MFHLETSVKMWLVMIIIILKLIYAINYGQLQYKIASDTKTVWPIKLKFKIYISIKWLFSKQRIKRYFDKSAHSPLKETLVSSQCVTNVVLSH